MKFGLKVTVALLVGFLPPPGFSIPIQPDDTAHSKAVDILHEMPADSELVVFSQSLDSLDAKVNSLVKLIGIPLETFGLQEINIAGLLSAALAGEGFTVEIDGSRGLGLAAPSLDNLEKMPLLYLPVIDAAAKMESLNLTQHPEVEGVWCVADICLMPRADYMVATEDVGFLKHLMEKPRGVQLSAGDLDLAERSDVALFVKVGSQMPKLRDEIMKEIVNSAELQAQPSFAQLATTAVERLTEMEQAGIGISLLDDGVSLKFSGQAQKGSTLAQYLSNHPMTDIKAFDRLPAGKMIEAYAIHMNPKLIDGPMTALLDAVIECPEVAEKINPEDIRTLKNMISRLLNVGYQKPTAVGMYLPAETQGAGIQVMELCTQADADEMFQVFSDLFPLITKIVEQAGFNLPMTYTQNVGQVGGLSYDELVVDLSYLPLPPEAMRLYAQLFGGEAKITEQICKIDDDYFVVAFGAGALEEAVQLAQSRAETLDTNAGIIQAAQHLPPQANVLFFLDIGNYLSWYIPMMQSTLLETMQAQGVSEAEMAEFNAVFGLVTGILGNAAGTLGGSIVMDQGRLGMEFYLPYEAVQSTVGPLIGILPQIIK